ncbi:Ig-like domain-containing protein [Cytobacillus sp. FJAT-54145]|uniref:Ig-like domain-containing protein n=1 Tax=Cytobacillus spartinae TaxID=3299023 RepID=A0ABW6KM59_9BACI
MSRKKRKIISFLLVLIISLLALIPTSSTQAAPMSYLGGPESALHPHVDGADILWAGQLDGGVYLLKSVNDNRANWHSARTANQQIAVGYDSPTGFTPPSGYQIHSILRYPVYVPRHYPVSIEDCRLADGEGRAGAGECHPHTFQDELDENKWAQQIAFEDWKYHKTEQSWLGQEGPFYIFRAAQVRRTGGDNLGGPGSTIAYKYDFKYEPINTPSLRIDPTTASINVGEEYSFKAYYKENGVETEITGSTYSTWTVSDTLIGSVVTKGRIKGKAKGSTKVTVTYKGLSAEATLYVGEIPPPEPEPEPEPDPNLPPTVTINAPSEVKAGDPFCISAAASDPDGTIDAYYWSTTLEGTLTGPSSCGMYSLEEGTESVDVSVTDDKGASASDSKTIRILPPTPSADLSIGGTLKENREVTLASTSTSPQYFPIVWEKVYYIIEPLEGQMIDLVKSQATNVTVTGNQYKVTGTTNFKSLFKVKGQYKVTHYVENTAGLSDTYTRTITIQEDLNPNADFSTVTTIYRDNTENERAIATIKVTDQSTSSDDVIAKRLWTYRYDSDNDESFDDETFSSIDSNNLTEVSFDTTKVGKYKIELLVIEEFGQPTIDEFVTADDRRRDDTNDKVIAEKVVEVKNLAPIAGFEVGKKKTVDLKIALEDTTLDVNTVTTKINSILKEKLNLENIELKLNVSKISSIKEELIGYPETFTKYGSDIYFKNGGTLQKITSSNQIVNVSSFTGAFFQFAQNKIFYRDQWDSNGNYGLFSMPITGGTISRLTGIGYLTNGPMRYISDDRYMFFDQRAFDEHNLYIYDAQYNNFTVPNNYQYKMATNTYFSVNGYLFYGVGDSSVGYPDFRRVSIQNFINGSMNLSETVRTSFSVSGHDYVRGNLYLYGRGNSESGLYKYDFVSNTLSKLPFELVTNYATVFGSGNGKYLFVNDNSNKKLYRYEISTNKTDLLIADSTNIRQWHPSYDGNSIYYQDTLLGKFIKHDFPSDTLSKITGSFGDADFNVLSVISNSAIKEIEQNASNLLSQMKDSSVNFAGLGTATNKQQIDSFVIQNNGSGLYLDNTNIDLAIQKLADHIIAEVTKRKTIDLQVALGNTTYTKDQVEAKLNELLKPKLQNEKIKYNLNIKPVNTLESSSNWTRFASNFGFRYNSGVKTGMNVWSNDGVNIFQSNYWESQQIPSLDFNTYRYRISFGGTFKEISSMAGYNHYSYIEQSGMLDVDYYRKPKDDYQNWENVKTFLIDDTATNPVKVNFDTSKYDYRMYIQYASSIYTSVKEIHMMYSTNGTSFQNLFTLYGESPYINDRNSYRNINLSGDIYFKYGSKIGGGNPIIYIDRQLKVKEPNYDVQSSANPNFYVLINNSIFDGQDKLITQLTNAEASLIGMGTPSNESQFNQVITGANGGKYFDNNNLDLAVQQMADYIIAETKTSKPLVDLQLMVGKSSSSLEEVQANVNNILKPLLNDNQIDATISVKQALEPYTTNSEVLKQKSVVATLDDGSILVKDHTGYNDDRSLYFGMRKPDGTYQLGARSPVLLKTMYPSYTYSKMLYTTDTGYSTSAHFINLKSLTDVNLGTRITAANGEYFFKSSKMSSDGKHFYAIDESLSNLWKVDVQTGNTIQVANTQMVNYYTLSQILLVTPNRVYFDAVSYSGTRVVYSMAHNGSGLRVESNFPTFPIANISYDGKYILANSLFNPSTIHSINESGSQLTIGLVATLQHAVDISKNNPKDNYLYYTNWTNGGTWGGPTNETKASLYRVNWDGTGLTRLLGQGTPYMDFDLNGSTIVYGTNGYNGTLYMQSSGTRLKTDITPNSKRTVFASLITNESITSSEQTNLIKSLLLTDGYFAGLGTAVAKTSIDNVIAQNMSRGTFIDNTNLATSMNQLGTYIINTMKENQGKNEIYLTLEDEAQYFTYYEDAENDPKFAERWRYNHNPSVFENNMGLASFNLQNLGTPVTKFSNVGRYQTIHAARDNPVWWDDNKFDPYRLWSKEVDNWYIYIHRKPIADFGFTINASTGQYTITNKAYDLDKRSIDIGYGGGIKAMSYQWREQGTFTWTNGLPPNPLARKVYEVKQEVEDFQKKKASVIKLLDATGVNKPPIADFDPIPTTIIAGETVTLQNKSYDPNGDPLKYNWYISTDNKATWTEFSQLEHPTRQLNAVGDVWFKVKATDQPFGLSDESEPKLVKVLPDNQPPTAGFEVDSPKYIGDIIEIRSTATDPDGDTLSYEYKLTKDGRTLNYKTGDSQVDTNGNVRLRFTDIQDIGEWTIVQTVSDGNTTDTSPSKTLVIQDLSITGNVGHTANWEDIHRNLGNAPNDFYSGETFKLSAVVDPVPVEQVKVTFQALLKDGTTLNESVLLASNPTTPTLYEGDYLNPILIEPTTAMVNGEVIFHFEVTYSNGVVSTSDIRIKRTDDVSINIIGTVLEAMKLHQRY